MNKNRWALLSVTDKTNLPSFAKGLVEQGYKLLSTGGTKKLLSEQGLSVTDVSEYTGSPEILDGRVKTLHPKVHAGILMDRDNQTHQQEALSINAEPIDLVVVNLYQFSQRVVSEQLDIDEAIEFIDIGGPTMLRAAAKNFKYCTVVTDPLDYDRVLAELKQHGEVVPSTRQRLAAKVFALTAQYDQLISDYLSPGESNSLMLHLSRIQNLRYGENPHQTAAVYAVGKEGFAGASILGGKELSYNNYLDLDAACQLVRDLGSNPAVAIIKHTNPCGAAVALDNAETLATTFQRAYDCDPQSAFGGIVAANQIIDEATAAAITERFIECVIAPDFEENARTTLATKKNLRIVKLPDLNQPPKGQQIRSILGAMLVQSIDHRVTTPAMGKVVTETKPTEQQWRDMAFAMNVVKHVKSNAIVYAKNGALLAVGAGQMSRIDSAKFAAEKAKEGARSLAGSVLASDAFFPFRDTVDLASQLGVSAIIQPGGSKRDDESITACNEAGIAMAFTGIRHFKH